MLKALRIENFALVDDLELEFHAGLNVLTGETGAGKSIILDALDAALGGPASSKLVRSGSRKACVEATFALNESLRDWLHRQQIDELDGGLVCSREFGDRTSRSRLNGVLVNRQQLHSLRHHLVEITAQGQALQLQDPAIQRDWLDAYGGSKALAARRSVRKVYQAWLDAKQLLERRREEQQFHLQQLDLLRFQNDELTAAELSDPSELESLDRDRDRLAHSVELQQQSYKVVQLLYEDSAGGMSASDLLGKAERVLADMCEFDPDLQSTLDMVREASIQAVEAGRELIRYVETVETDPARLADIEQRSDLLKQLCRKYGPTLTDTIAHAQSVSQKLQDLTDGGTSIEALEAKEQQARKRLQQVGDRLTALRQQAGDRLCKRLVAELKPLAMDAVQFVVQLTPTPFTMDGCDRVTFLFGPNPGEPLQPLADVASGGEMNRFLLALKATLSQIDNVSTLVFDEIDAGVSGKVAQAIAAKFHGISQTHQVLCVTHQPLIAAMADCHIQVSKLSRNRRTVVRATPLSTAERRNELAQLAGGHSAHDAMAFADALLAQAAQLRNNNAPQTETVPPAGA